MCVCGTSGNSSTELNITADSFCCSGRFRRCFTEPFLHTSMMLSLEPGGKDRETQRDDFITIIKYLIFMSYTVWNLQHQSVPLELETDCRRSQERRKCLFTCLMQTEQPKLRNQRINRGMDLISSSILTHFNPWTKKLNSKIKQTINSRLFSKQKTNKTQSMSPKVLFWNWPVVSRCPTP